MSPVRPSAESTATSLPNINTKPQSWNLHQDKATKRLIEQTLHLDDFKLSIFDRVCNLPGFKTLTQEALQEYHNSLSNSLAVGRLIRLAYTQNDDHLGLELLENLTANTLSAALDNNLKADGDITSLSTRIDSIQSTPAELTTAPSKVTLLAEICFVQSPTSESDAPSTRILTALATQTEVLSRAKTVFAGAYSSALRKKF